MFDKIQWKQEWRLLQRDKKNYYGNVLHTDKIVKLTDDNKTINVILPEEELNFESNSDFYGFANRCILISAHVIPNELLEFEVCSYLERENTTEVKIQKISSNEYSIEIYSEEYTGGTYYSPQKDIKEVLTKTDLSKKLLNIPDVFEAYPFLVLTLGNCFD